jgi:hypothetical protein
MVVATGASEKIVFQIPGPKHSLAFHTHARV